jgi:hypothetical protein
MVRLPALVACGTRTIIDAVFGTDRLGETGYAHHLLGALRAAGRQHVLGPRAARRCRRPGQSRSRRSKPTERRPLRRRDRIRRASTPRPGAEGNRPHGDNRRTEHIASGALAGLDAAPTGGRHRPWLPRIAGSVALPPWAGESTPAATMT